MGGDPPPPPFPLRSAPCGKLLRKEDGHRVDPTRARGTPRARARMAAHAVYEHRVGGSMGRVRRDQVQHACAEAGEGRGATGRGGGVEYATALNLLEPVEHHMHARTHGSTRSLRASCRRADEVAGDAERTSAIEGRRIEVTCHVCGEEDAEVGSGRGRGSSDAGHGELRSSLSSKWFTGNM